MSLHNLNLQQMNSQEHKVTDKWLETAEQCTGIMEPWPESTVSNQE